MTALETALKQFGGMRNVARVIRTSTGADLPMPLLDDTANVASIVGENTTLGTASLTFGQTTFKAWKYSTGIVLVPFELLQDSSVNVGEVVGGALGTRIARGTNADFTSGNGTTAPQGIVTAANVGLTSTTLGNVTYDEIVTLIHSVDAAYRQNGVFMLHDQTLAAIRKLKDDGGRPLFWSDAQSLASGIEGTILGYKYVVNNDMPALATASAKSILFGDFNAGYAIRDVQDVQILRLAERYADVGQVAFVGLSRHDGRVIDAGTHPVQAFKNKAS
jgi:HK97 family phage major capsid protein